MKMTQRITIIVLIGIMISGSAFSQMRKPSFFIGGIVTPYSSGNNFNDFEILDNQSNLRAYIPLETDKLPAPTFGINAGIQLPGLTPNNRAFDILAEVSATIGGDKEGSNAFDFHLGVTNYLLKKERFYFGITPKVGWSRHVFFLNQVGLEDSSIPVIGAGGKTDAKDRVSVISSGLSYQLGLTANIVINPKVRFLIQIGYGGVYSFSDTKIHIASDSSADTDEFTVDLSSSDCVQVNSNNQITDIPKLKTSGIYLSIAWVIIPKF